VIVIAEGYEAERLQTGALKLAGGMEHFGHTADGSGAGMECDFDEVSRGKLMLQLQHSTGNRDGLKFCARSLATFGHDGGRDRSIEFDTG